MTERGKGSAAGGKLRTTTVRKRTLRSAKTSGSAAAASSFLPPLTPPTMLLLLLVSSALLLSAASDASAAAAAGEWEISNNDNSMMCVRMYKKQVALAYVNCVYRNLDGDDRNDGKDRAKAWGRCREGADDAAADAAAFAAVATAAVEGDGGVSKGGKSATKASDAVAAAAGSHGEGRTEEAEAEEDAGEVGDHKIRRRRRHRRRRLGLSSRPSHSSSSSSLRRNDRRRHLLGKKSSPPDRDGGERNCLRNADMELIDTITSSCAMARLSLNGCRRVMTTFINTMASEERSERAKLGGGACTISTFDCDTANAKGANLFCARECFNGHGCRRGDIPGDFGFCQPCGTCEDDGDVFDPGFLCEDVCDSFGTDVAPTLLQVINGRGGGGGDDGGGGDAHRLGRLSEVVAASDDPAGIYLSDPTMALTVFAPDDHAFERIDKDAEAVVAKFLDDAVTWNAHLSRILMHHLVRGRIFSSDIVDDDNGGGGGGDGEEEVAVNAVSGEVLVLTANERGRIKINDGEAAVRHADVAARNGVMHVIDGLLLPKFVFRDLVDVIFAHPELTVLADVLRPCEDLARNILGRGGPFTLFAPNDGAKIRNALRSLLPGNGGGGTVDDLDCRDASSRSAMTLLVKTHTVKGRNVVSSDVEVSEKGIVVASMEGRRWRLNRTPNGVLRIDNRRVVEADVLANNGIVHIIESVLPLSVVH